MAAKKSGKKTGRKAAKARKLPKTIAGVKVPKELRAPGGRLLEVVSNPLVIDAAAAALAAAAARFAETLRDRPDAPRATRAAPASKPASKSASTPAADLGAILAATALEGMRRLGTVSAADDPNGREKS